MLDPALIHDLQRAMVPPSLPPLAIVQEWRSPMTEQAERDMAPVLAAADLMFEEWAKRVDKDVKRLWDIQWTDRLLGILDRIIGEVEAKAEKNARSSARQRRRDARLHGELARLDPSVAAAQRRHSRRIQALRDFTIERQLDIALQMRAHRAKVDTRLGPSTTFEDPGDLASFLEAVIAA